MGSSNRHGGAKLSRRLKVLFNGHDGRRNVFRNYFGVKKNVVETSQSSGGAAAASQSTPPAQK